MLGEEWDDEEAESYPSAPLPPHERTWRHPSELGRPVVAVSTPPVFGRLALVGAGVVTVALVVGLMQLLSPRSGSSVFSTEATSAPRDITVRPRATMADPGPVLARAASALRGRSSLARPTLASVRTSGPSGTLPTRPTNAVSTLVLAGSGRAAVPIGDGARAVTTAGALETRDTLTVRLADGTSTEAVVVSVDQGANLAVLALTDAAAEGTPVTAGEPHTGDVVYVGCDELVGGVLVDTGQGMVVDMAPGDAAAADEGAPVLDASGALVGLADPGPDGVVRLVPLTGTVATSAGSSDAAPPTTATATTVVVLDVWLGVTFGGDDLVIAGVQPGAPAEVAGVLVGDRLLAIDDMPIGTADDLWDALVTYDPGHVVSLVVDREGVAVTLTVTLGERPS